jgi:hypothetical protein
MGKDTENIEKNKDPRIRMYAITAYYVYQQCFKKAGIIDNGKFEKELWVSRLLKKLEEEYPDNKAIIAENYATYIRDRFNNACNYINNDKPYKWIGYASVNFEPFLKYSEINNTTDIDCAFKIPAMEPRFVIDKVENSKIAYTAPVFIPKEKTEPEPVAEPESITELEPETEFKQAIAETSIVPFVKASKPSGRLNLFPQIIKDEGTIHFYSNGDCEFMGETSFTIKKGDVISAEITSLRNDGENLWIILKYVSDQHTYEIYIAQPIPGAGPLQLAHPKYLCDMLNSLVT